VISTRNRQYWHCCKYQHIFVALLLHRLWKQTFGQYDIIPDKIALYP